MSVHDTERAVVSEPPWDSADAAEAAFYSAFEAGDVDRMMDVWADDDGIVCVHPMGEHLVGRRAVRESWQQIFENRVMMRFEIAEVERAVSGDLAVHCVYEDIDHGPQLRQRSRILATNVFRRTRSGWRMIVHHASPDGARRATDDPVPPTAPAGAGDGARILH